MAKVVRQFSSVFLFLILFGCLEEKNIVQTPVDDDKLVNPEADLINAIMDVTSQDGSFDNILDNSSCLTALYPFSVRVRGARVDLNSPDDIPALELLYEQEVTNPNQFQIIYPVKVSTADYSIVEVGNAEEMEQLRNDCIEGGEDADIECVDFVYPVNISSLDTLNQVASVIEINEDKPFYHLMAEIKDPNSTEVLEINYPVALQDFNGNSITVESNDELYGVIESYRNSCEEGDSTYIKELRMGQLIVGLVDAPFPTGLVDEIQIHIDRFEVVYHNEFDGTRTISLYDPEDPTIIDLLSLINGNVFDLANQEVPIGEYSSFNLILSEVNVFMENGDVFDVNVPGGKNGLKIPFENGYVIDYTQTVNLLIDFDVSQSFKAQGSPNSPNGIMGFTMTPTFKILDYAASGSIQGTIRNEASNATLEGAQISLIETESGETSSATFSDTNGNYTFPAIPQGTYSILFEKEGYTSFELSDISISASDLLDINALLQEE